MKGHVLDVVAVVWIAITGYLSTIGVGLVSFPGSSWWWLSSPLVMLPGLAWLGYSIYKLEGYGPTHVATKSVAFGAGLVVLLITQFPAIAQALSRIF